LAWQKLNSDTLGSAGDSLSISFTKKIFNVFLSHIFGSSTVDIDETFNNNTNGVYAVRKSADSGADETPINDTKIDKNTTATTIFDINYVCSVLGEEKLVIGFLVDQSTAGAGTPPSRLEYVAKFVPSPDAEITSVEDKNTGTTNEYSIGSNLIGIGTD